MSNSTTVTGVILAGGLARRMHQQDKGLMLFKDKPLISYAIAAMQPLANPILLNANRNELVYQQFGWPVIADQTGHFDGPLAGILTAMQMAKTETLLVMPCDSPLLTSAHLQRLLDERAANDSEIAVAFDGERLHPVFLALKTCLKGSLQAYLASDQRKVDAWLTQHRLVKVDFSNDLGCFVNVNTLSELASLERKIGQ